MRINGDGYVFSLDGEFTPVCGKHLRNGLKKALNNIGIDKTEVAERGLYLHAWLLDVA
jgi:hypothetical protein